MFLRLIHTFFPLFLAVRRHECTRNKRWEGTLPSKPLKMWIVFFSLFLWSFVLFLSVEKSCIGLVHGTELDVLVIYSQGSFTLILPTNCSDSSQTTRAQLSESEIKPDTNSWYQNHTILETRTKYFQISRDWIGSQITVNFSEESENASSLCLFDGTGLLRFLSF